MISLNKSVGTNAVNQLDDLRKIQLTLLELDLLAPADFLQECLEDHLLKKLSTLRQRVLLKDFPIHEAFLTVLLGNTAIVEAMIPATLQAVFAFQTTIQKKRNPDGRIDPNGKSLRALNQARKKRMEERKANPTTNTTTDTTPEVSSSKEGLYEILRDDDRISLSFPFKNRPRKKLISITDGRNFICKNYNWNGIVKLMRFVMDAGKKFYTLPTNLSGTVSDNQLIIPDEAIFEIVKLQVEYQIKRLGIKQSTIHRILNGVDAKPGNIFIGKIVAARDRINFMNEAKNDSLVNIETGEMIAVPNRSEDEATHYHFFRNLVHARNGLWSDVAGVTNIVGLRRTIDKKRNTHYNDTIAVCWKEATGALRVELNVATTEPGNRVKDRQLGPQTMTVVSGFHNVRQPAGRTHNVLKQGRNDGAFVWNEGDSTMNFHQGNNNFSYPGKTKHSRNAWLSFHGIDGKTQHGIPTSKFDARALLEMNKVFSEIYLILSKYGNNRTVAPYAFLQNLVQAQAVSIDKLEGAQLTIRQGNKTKKIDLNKAKQWMVKFWFPKRKTGGRKKIAAILSSISDFDPTTLKTWEKLSAKQIIEKITLTHMRKVVEIQIEYTSKLSAIDGLAGSGFVRMIDGICENKTQAAADKLRLDTLIDRLADFPLRNIDTLKQRLKTRLFIHTYNNRAAVKKNTQFDETSGLDLIKNETVGVYSAGCQVIYDTEVFYTFWTKLLKQASRAGQLRWYYTLVDATKFPKSAIV
ncbi:MAG: hypothetical protein AB8G15_16780 [Saprospiraceae bacterium]